MTKKKDNPHSPRTRRNRAKSSPSNDSCNAPVSGAISVHKAGDEIQFGDWLIKLKGASGTSVCTATATEGEAQGWQGMRIHTHGGSADLALEEAKKRITAELKARSLFRKEPAGLFVS